VHDKASDAPVLLSNSASIPGIAGGAYKFSIQGMLGTLVGDEWSL